MRWITVIRNFEEQWKALVKKRDEDEPETPLISKALPIIKWCEAFKDHLHRSVGVRYVPLAYVVRETETPPVLCPPLATGQPYSMEHGSIEMDLVERAQHTHGLYRDDNAAVYYKIEEATRGTQYADSIKTFQRKKDGRGAFMALSKQYAGPDKWESQLKRMMWMMMHQGREKELRKEWTMMQQGTYFHSIRVNLRKQQRQNKR